MIAIDSIPFCGPELPHVYKSKKDINKTNKKDSHTNETECLQLKKKSQVI